MEILDAIEKLELVKSRSEIKRLIKSNGIRNELKEIRKSIDKLTNALIEIHNAQTNNHGKKNNSIINSSHNG